MHFNIAWLTICALPLLLRVIRKYELAISRVLQLSWIFCFLEQFWFRERKHVRGAWILGALWFFSVKKEMRACWGSIAATATRVSLSLRCTSTSTSTIVTSLSFALALRWS